MTSLIPRSTMHQDGYLPVRTQPSTGSEENVDLGRLYGLLLDNKWKILLCALLFALGGLVYALLSTPVYQGDALIQVEKKGTPNANDQLAALLNEETPTTAAQIEILSSRLIMGQAALQQDLDISVSPVTFPVIGNALIRYDIERPGFAENRPEIWGGESIQVSSLSVDPELVNKQLVLEVLPDNQYRLLSSEDESIIGTGQVGEMLSTESPWVELKVAEIQAPPGARFIIVKRSRQSAINYLKSRFTVVQRGVDTGVLELTLTGTDPAEVRSSLDAITEVYLAQNIARQAEEAEKSLVFLDKQMPKVRDQLVEAENRLNSYRSEQDSVDLSQETQNMLSGIVEVERRLNELKMQETELSQRFTPNHPAYTALLEKKAQLQRERANLEERTGDLPETQQQILRMTRDVEVTQQIYVQLLNRMQELNIAKAGTVGNVRIIDFSMVGAGPISPKVTMIVVLATLVGLLLSISVVLIRGLINKGVESADQLEDLGLPVYATIPMSDDQKKLVKRVKQRNNQASKYAIGNLLGKVNPTDVAVESLRGLRTSLHFAMLDAPNNSIMITGPSPGVGKSFISINLALVCAQAGQKVLLIDADMRKGNIHIAFNDRSEAGLSEVLSGKLHAQHAIRESDVPGLYYMSRGVAPPNPSELLMKQNFAELINEVKSEFDLILVDTPPILAVTDAAIVGKTVGTTLLATRFGLNPPREIKVATRRLESAGIEVKGCILNAIERTAAASYGYGYYNYSYK